MSADVQSPGRTAAMMGMVRNRLAAYALEALSAALVTPRPPAQALR